MSNDLAMQRGRCSSVVGNVNREPPWLGRSINKLRATVSELEVRSTIREASVDLPAPNERGRDGKRINRGRKVLFGSQSKRVGLEDACEVWCLKMQGRSVFEFKVLIREDLVSQCSHMGVVQGRPQRASLMALRISCGVLPPRLLDADRLTNVVPSFLTAMASLWNRAAPSAAWALLGPIVIIVEFYIVPAVTFTSS